MSLHQLLNNQNRKNEDSDDDEVPYKLFPVPYGLNSEDEGIDELEEEE